MQSWFARDQSRPAGVLFEYPPVHSVEEERVNGWTHGIAATISLVGMVWLVAKACREASPLMAFGCALYCGSLTLVFTMSALSHSVFTPRWRHVFRTLDQAAIYLLTAASFTPYYLKFLVPQGWDWVLPTMWIAALVLAWDKLRGSQVNSVSIPAHLALAAFPFVAAVPVFSVMPAGCIGLVVAAVVCYLVGIVFFIADHRGPYFHAIWHLMVIAASACTFAGIPLYLL